MNQRIGICCHGTRILPISIAHEGILGFFHFKKYTFCILTPVYILLLIVQIDTRTQELCKKQGLM